jgi:hypothetical protein
MAKVVIEYPDELTQLTIDAFWSLYGGGGEANEEDKRRFCHATIKRMIAEQVGKYVAQQETVVAIAAAKQAGQRIMDLAESVVEISSVKANVPGD